MRLRSQAVFLLVLTLVAGFTAANAVAQTTFTFETPVGATAAGNSVDASAVFAINGNTITITLTNLEANPTSIAQALSGIDFDLSTGQKWGTLTSSSAQRIRVHRNGSFVLGSTGATDWGLRETFQGGMQLTALDFRGADDLLIGAPAGNNYSDANRSLDGNKHHNLFLDQTATFVLTIPCLKGSPAITDVAFVFGADGARGQCDSGKKVHGDPAVTPEPATMLLFGSGLAALGAFRRKFRTAA